MRLPRTALFFRPVMVAVTAIATISTGVLAIGSGQTLVQESQERTRVTYDDLLARVEKTAPGFGGMFVDAEGRLVVYLLDTAQLPAARAAIEAVFGPGRVPATGMRAVQGRYVISQLKAWAERARGVLTTPGVTLVDLDEAKNRVTVGVDDASRTRTVEQALSSLKIPREAVLIEVTGRIVPLDAR